MTLEVIGAGLGRTGTMSLKYALEELGFGPCHHMSEMHAHPESWDFWTRAFRGEIVDWEEGYQTYRSAVDDPTVCFYTEVAETFPDARVILTHRDPERWFESVQSLSKARLKLLESLPPDKKPLADLLPKMGWDPRDPRTHDRTYMLDWFHRHFETVRNTIAQERLLVYQVKDGWEPLCRFLDVETPETEFPHVNTSERFRKAMVTGEAPKRRS